MSDIENTENTATETTEAPAKEKRARVVEPKRYFLGGKFARPETVFGFIRGVVARNGRDGMMSDDIISTVLAEFTPKKSANFDRNYVQAYLRDCPKFGYLTLNADEQADGLGEAPVRAKKEKTEGGNAAPSVTKAGQEFLNELRSHFTEDNRDTKGITVKDVADGLKKTARALAKVASKLEKDGFVTTKVDGEDTLVAFTDAGWAIAVDVPEAEETEAE